MRRGVNNGEKGEDRWSEHGLGHLMNPDRSRERRSQLDRAGVAWDRAPIARPSHDAAAVCKARRGWAHDREQPRGDETAQGAQRREALRAADQAVQLHPQLPRAAARPSGRRESRTLPPYRAVRDRSAQMGAPAVDRSVFNEGSTLSDQHDASDPTRQIARVKSYGDVLEEYEFHEEAKCADASGAPCGKQSVGLLLRRHVAIESRRIHRQRVEQARRGRGGRLPDAATLTPNIPIRGATSGKLSGCRCCYRPRFPSCWSKASAGHDLRCTVRPGFIQEHQGEADSSPKPKRLRPSQPARCTGSKGRRDEHS